MTAKVFTGILPPKLISKIESYQHSVKNSDFIVGWMKRLNNRVKIQNRIYWQMLIRDSKDIIIQLPHHQLQLFNFAHFVQDFLKSGNAKFFYKQFEQFCINAIQNNPSHLLNRYYVGNGGSPCFELFSTFIFCGTVNGTPQYNSFEELEDSVFKIYKFIMEKQYLSSQYYQQFLYGFNYGNYTKRYTVEVLQLFFQHYETLFLDAKFGDINVQHNYIRQTLSTFFENLFKKYCSKGINQYISSMRKCKEDKQQEFNETIHQRKVLIIRFLYYFQERHCLILHKYQKYLVQHTFKHITYQLLKQMVAFPGFHPLIFSEEYIYHLVQTRKVKLFALLWSFEERVNISKYRYNNKNILQITAENRGLSYNLIDMLWSSGLFQALPKIKNQKSKQIIHQRYNILGQKQ